MTNICQILDDLFQNKKIELCRGSIFDQAPDFMPPGFDFDKIEGMMIGLSQSPAGRKAMETENSPAADLV